MWLCLAAGDLRAFAGHDGYDDDITSRYVWDSRVQHSSELHKGDFVLIWNTRRLLGVSVIDQIERRPDVKVLRRCPACNTTKVKARRTKSPVYKCNLCGSEFHRGVTELVPVEVFEAGYEPAWVGVERLIEAPALRQMCRQPQSQHSMRELVPDRVAAVLGSELTAAMRRARVDHVWPINVPGHLERVVRVRVGQQRFREELLGRYDESCAFTGPAPAEALEAAHLYSYAKVGNHETHGGLLLRRDVHRLFDAGLIRVEPRRLVLRVDERVGQFAPYEALEGGRVQAKLASRQQDWLAAHWAQHAPKWP